MQVKYGAAVNALNHVTDNLMNVKIQTQSSLSQVMDADYALETSRFAAAQIIRQASTAILAQANTSKETILTLLKDL
jgi:flagellin